jgi:hypothetical protein
MLEISQSAGSPANGRTAQVAPTNGRLTASANGKLMVSPSGRTLSHSRLSSPSFNQSEALVQLRSE